MTPKAPALVRRSASARKAWRDLWRLLDEGDRADDVYAPMVAMIAVELGLADDASNAVYRPIDPATGKRGKRTLEEYLQGRNSQTAQELTLLRDSLKQAAKLVAEFGSSPLAEKKLGAKKPKQALSEMGEFIRAREERLNRGA